MGAAYERRNALVQAFVTIPTIINGDACDG
jgi:hypothetical protein